MYQGQRANTIDSTWQPLSQVAAVHGEKLTRDVI
jgi:hypothetical protein